MATLDEEEIKQKKAILFGVLLAVAVPLAVDRCDRLEEKLESVFWNERPAVVYQVASSTQENSQAPEQDPSKYTPPRQISDNPHHYIPNQR